MPQSVSRFVWYDLATVDPEAAIAFYSSVVGWHTEDTGMPSYTLLAGDSGPVAGVMPFPPGSPETHPHWTAFIGVEDVDSTAVLAEQRGGTLLQAPQDIPGIGRYASVTDPGGAHFRLFQPNRDAPQPESAPWAPGTVGWHELHASDGPEAFRFYTTLFRWTPGEALDMGNLGTYQMFTSGPNQGGGIMTKVPEQAQPAWLLYFNVEALDASSARVTEGGGTIKMGPHQVPGGSWIVACQDPQGGFFALVSRQR